MTRKEWLDSIKAKRKAYEREFGYKLDPYYYAKSTGGRKGDKRPEINYTLHPQPRVTLDQIFKTWR